VGGSLPGLSHQGTGESPVYGLSGVPVAGEGVDKGVASPGSCILVS